MNVMSHEELFDDAKSTPYGILFRLTERAACLSSIVNFTRI